MVSSAEPSPSSTSDDFQEPVWTSMSIKEAMQLIFVEHDSVPEFASDTLKSLWEADPMFATYMGFAPTWTRLFMEHSLVSGYSSDK
eukprot:6323190-Amphidinium_carterae.1